MSSFRFNHSKCKMCFYEWLENHPFSARGVFYVQRKFNSRSSITIFLRFCWTLFFHAMYFSYWWISDHFHEMLDSFSPDCVFLPPDLSYDSAKLLASLKNFLAILSALQTFIHSERPWNVLTSYLKITLFNAVFHCSPVW